MKNYNVVIYIFMLTDVLIVKWNLMLFSNKKPFDKLNRKIKVE